MIEFAAGFAAGESAGTGAMFLLGGLVPVASGALQAARPGFGAVILVLLFGLFVITYGVSQIVLGSELRQGGATLHSVLHGAA